MKYLIFGVGYIGKHMSNGLEESIAVSDRILTSDDALKHILFHNPDWVINCMGVTGKPNVDWCENHKGETLFGNVELPLNIAKACDKIDTPLLHIGSGCVYTGDNQGDGFSESDGPNFTGSFYSKTKIISEDMLNDFNVLQARIRMPIDSDIGCERNLINKIIGFKEVIAEKNSISIVEDMVAACKTLMENECRGVYNVVNPKPMTHPQILDLYTEIIDANHTYNVIDVASLEKKLIAKRSNCVLNTNKITKICHLKPLPQRIEEYLTEYSGRTIN